MTEITITVRLNTANSSEELITWLAKAIRNTGFTAKVAEDQDGNGQKAKKARKPLSDQEKVALNARFAQGRIDKAVERGEEPKPRDLELVALAQAADGNDVQPNAAKIAKAEAAGKKAKAARRKKAKAAK